MLIDQAIVLLKNDAENKKLNAGYSGRYDDGGCSGMILQIEAFEAGRIYEINGVIPIWLQSYADQVEMENDPEYSEYQRLKEKFE